MPTAMVNVDPDLSYSSSDDMSSSSISDPPKSQSPSVGPSASGPVDVPALEAPAPRDVDGSACGKKTDGAGTADVRGLLLEMAVVVTVVERSPCVWASAKCIAAETRPPVIADRTAARNVQLGSNCLDERRTGLLL